MNYVFLNAGTNGLPNNFFSDSYWGKNDDGTFIVATMSDPDGSGTTDELRNQKHTVRCVKLRYPSLIKVNRYDSKKEIYPITPVCIAFLFGSLQ